MSIQLRRTVCSLIVAAAALIAIAAVAPAPAYAADEPRGEIPAGSFQTTYTFDLSSIADEPSASFRTTNHFEVARTADKPPRERPAASFETKPTVVLARAADEPAAEKPAAGSGFRVGIATRDITPTEPTPMWGYGDRHALLSQGVIDPLLAKIVVIEAGGEKVAIVGTDIGRGPTPPMMAQIRSAIEEKAGIKHVMISGSHSHHGPVIELTDREGFGRGKYDAAVAYSKKLPEILIEGILEADAALVPAKIGVGQAEIPYNRNRHTKRQPKAVDPTLAVIRFDREDGTPLALVVNFAAHPVMYPGAILKFSPDYPGFMKRKVEKELGTHCVFMQGASGDMSPNPPEGVSGPEQFGEALADRVLEVAKGITPSSPAEPSIKGRTDRFNFRPRTDFGNPLIVAAYGRAFFPELVRNFSEEFRNGVGCELNTVLLNNEIALVGGSGEFFCNHANRLRQRSYVPNTLFFGYCNGHNLYFPTIEAVSEGGYGADAAVSPVEIGAGERMMNQALKNLYVMLRKIGPKEAGIEPAAQPTSDTAGTAAAN
jgi:neutral ceramidase